MIKIDNINIIHFIMMERMEAALARRETVVEILACPFSSLRLLEENTREPISGEKTRAQSSRPGVHCSDHQRQTPGRQGREICRWRKRPLKRALRRPLPQVRYFSLMERVSRLIFLTRRSTESGTGICHAKPSGTPL